MKGTSKDSPVTRGLPPIADRVDHALARLSGTLDWIRSVSPTNLAEQWQHFKRSDFLRIPVFTYREKPRLVAQRDEIMALPVTNIEHPILRSLLTEKQRELARLMELIDLRGTSGFLPQSITLFGEAEPVLLEKAKEILAFKNIIETEPNYIGAAEFVQAAAAEIDYYKADCKEFNATVSISEHIAAGVMVVDGQLVVAADLKTRKEGLKALLQHEIGTHIVTSFNGSQQMVRQLKSGLAHYDATQEGLGVLAEYLCGNLPLGRLKTLAGRVVAIRAMTQGADFVEIHRILTRDFDISPYGAFVTAARVTRGGGLTKDAVYLRGLLEILGYLKEGHPLEDLFIGKFSLSQATALAELQRQGWLVPARLLPRYWSDPGAHQRLQLCAEAGLPRLLLEATA